MTILLTLAVSFRMQKLLDIMFAGNRFHLPQPS